MFRHTMLVIGALTIVLTLGACGGPGTVKLNEENAGSTVELQVGGTLEVVLEGNPTTGYNWEVDSVDTAILKQVGETEFEPDSSAIGSGGQVTLRFEAATSGQTMLRLVYHRPWEEGVEPLETFEVTVVVK